MNDFVTPLPKTSLEDLAKPKTFPQLIAYLDAAFHSVEGDSLTDRVDTALKDIKVTLEADHYIGEGKKALLLKEDTANQMIWDVFKELLSKGIATAPTASNDQKYLVTRWTTGLFAIDHFFERYEEEDRTRAAHHHKKFLTPQDVETAQKIHAITHVVLDFHQTHAAEFGAPVLNPGFGERFRKKDDAAPSL